MNSTILDGIESLGECIRAHAERCEQERRVPDVVIDELARAGLLSLALPQELGGHGCSVTEVLQAVETVATHDASTGWVMAVTNAHHAFTGYVSEAVAREVFVPGTVVAGHLAPVGTADRVEGGYLVSGHWPFVSGCMHADWLIGGVFVTEGGERVLLPDGSPDARMAIFPKSDVTVLDTWTVAGLCGTGSHDVEAEAILVPEERLFSIRPGARLRDETFFEFPIRGWLSVILAPPALGIGRRALDEIVELVHSKPASRGRPALSDRPVIQHELARAEATWRSGRAFLYEICRDVEELVASRGSITDSERALLRLATAHAATSSREAVEAAYLWGGGTSLYRSSVLQRLLRDIHGATQHVLLTPASYELVGSVLLGRGSTAAL